MYLDLYKIDGTKNLDANPCFSSAKTYPNFQEKLSEFKDLLVDLVDKNESKTFYKFGDGDYFFLKGEAVGSATPGRRALSKPYNQIDHIINILLCHSRMTRKTYQLFPFTIGNSITTILFNNLMCM